MRYIKRANSTVIILAVGCFAWLGCSSSSDSSSGTCINVAGDYLLNNQCQSTTNDPCTVTQTGCSLSVACASGSFGAAISGSQLTFSPSTGVNCTANVVEGSWSGTCNTGGSSTCSFQATKK